MAAGDRLQWAQDAKEDFLAQTGRTNEEDSTFERRMAVYLEYFLLEWTIAGVTPKTPLELFYSAHEATLPALDKNLLAALSSSHSSLFELLRKDDDEVFLGDLLYGGRWYVRPEGAMLGVEEGDVFQARLLALDGVLFFTRAFLHHPSEARHLVKKIIQKQRENNVAPSEIIGRLAKMHLKFDRYRRMNMLQIYTL